MKKNQGSTIYPRHRLETLEPFYSQHVSAMTTEGLHHKGDIAEQLAWRDARIEQLEAELAERRNSVCTIDYDKLPEDLKNLPVYPGEAKP